MDIQKITQKELEECAALVLRNTPLEHLQMFVDNLPKVKKMLPILVLGGTETLDLISEKEMAKFGWFKHNSNGIEKCKTCKHGYVASHFSCEKNWDGMCSKFSNIQWEPRR